MTYPIFLKHVLRQPEALAVVTSTGERYTYQKAFYRVNQWANYFLSQGIESNDRLGVLLDNEDHHFFIFLALELIGSVYVPFDADIPKKQLADDINGLNLKKILTFFCTNKSSIHN